MSANDETLPARSAAILAITVRRPAEEPVETAAPAVVVAAAAAPEAEAPPVSLEAPAATGEPAPAVATGVRTDDTAPDKVVRRLSGSVVASIALHVGAVALFAWLSLMAPTPVTTGEDSVPVELVVAAEAGAASQQETASGQEESPNQTTSEQREAVEAPTREMPPEETPPEPIEPQPTPEQVIDQLPPPPMPETEPVIEPPPPQPEQRVETQAPSEVQAVTEPPRVTPPPVQQPRPVVRRPPPVRRQVTPPRERPRPVREARPVRQTASRAATPERGQGTGQRNRQASAGSAAGGAASAAAAASYRARVLAHLARFKIYPDSARERGISGRTAVSFTLSRSGGVTSVSIASSSGAPILDQATLSMVRRAVPFPPMPEGGAGSMSFTAGINYSLR